MDFSVVSCCDAAPVLEAAEHAFDHVALVVGGTVVGVLDAAMAHGRDHGDGAALGEQIAQSIGVVAFVGEEFAAGWQALDALLRGGNIRYISSGYDEAPGPSALVANGVDFGRAAPCGTADTIGQGPPLAPPAVR